MHEQPVRELPPPLYASKEIGTLTAKDGRVFNVVMGLSEDLVKQLTEYSRNLEDVELQNNSSDFKRFAEGSYEEWYEKERTTFALVDPTNGKMAAVGWIGPKPLGRDSAKHLSQDEQGRNERAIPSDDWHTISFRSYGEYRGTGLMKGFAKLAVEAYKKGYPNAKIWSITDRSNIGSAKLSEALGLKEHPESTDTRVVMAEPE